MSTICPFCGLDPYEYIYTGTHLEPVAVNCCGYGYMMFSLGMSHTQVRWNKSVREPELVTIEQASSALEIPIDLMNQWRKKGLMRMHSTSLVNLDEVILLKHNHDGLGSHDGFYILHATEPSTLTAIELFAGGGGSALGLHNAGIRVVALNEIDDNALDTLKTNMPEADLLSGDVAEFSFSQYKRGADIVSAGFPCQPFSYTGKGLGLEDTRGTLFYEFARCVSEVQPKVALAENVRGLVSHDKGKTLQAMTAALGDLGYRVSYKLLRSQFHDVPQKRERVFIIGVRQDLDTPALFPVEKGYVIPLRQTLRHVPQSEGLTYSERKANVMRHVPPGGNWRHLPPDVLKEYMGKSLYSGGGKTGVARRLSWNEPCLTLTTSPNQKQTERCHPDETRPLTVREYARIQTFPDNWTFSGSLRSQYRQIGNATPVNLAYHVGISLREMLERK